MSDYTVHINKITEHKDGSATLDVEVPDETYKLIFEYGLQMLFLKAAENAKSTLTEGPK